MNDCLSVVKDEENELPVPIEWRGTIKNIVSSFVMRDFGLSKAIPLVEPISIATENQIRDYLDSYEEVLVNLPEETWKSSIYLWMGNHWDLMIDLWIEGEGRSDMVLAVSVREINYKYNFTVSMIYVP